MTRKVHVIGAGLAGMAAAMEARALGAQVVVHEATGHCGGRARSFLHARLGCEIDNGNHLMLSGNHAVRRLIHLLDATGELDIAPAARFEFFEPERHFRWFLELDDGPLPRWILDPERRVPDTALPDYLKGLKLLLAGDFSVAALFDDGGSMWKRFWEPFALGVLNTPPEEAAARLLLPVIAETLARGGRHSRPMTARRGLSHLFAHPFERRVARDPRLTLRMGDALRAVDAGPDGIRRLTFDSGDLVVTPQTRIILAVPPWTARELLPFLMAPDAFAPIVNVHFRLEAGRMPADAPAMCGILGGTAQWVFTRGDVASVTISAAFREARMDGEALARACWPEVAALLSIDEDPLPAFRVVKEKRATFLATPAQLAKRPPAATGLPNLFLAGDWTDTGLPATIEGAVRSGFRAARLALEAAT